MAPLRNVDYFNDRIPSEIMLKILSGLKKRDLKRVRFTCKKLASLGGQLLIVNLYLSPREKDMQVFDAVTQHADLKKSVQNIIFDSAQFTRLSMVEYFQEHRNAYQAGAFKNLGKAQADIEEMYTAMEKANARVQRGILISHHEVEQFMRHPVIIEGYQQYSFHAQELGNLFLRSWYTRALEGLQKLGQLKIAALGNSWELIYRPNFYISKDDDELEESSEDGVFEESTAYNDPVGAISLLQELGIGYSTAKIMAKSLDPKRIQSDGKRLRGSPSARAWLPTTLQPTSPASMERDDTSISTILSTGKTNGCFEFVEFVKLLDTAEKRPSTFEVKKDLTQDCTTGVALSVFDFNRSPESVHFVSLSKFLKSLDMRFAVRLDGSPTALFPDLNVLKGVFKGTTSLTALKLSFPYQGEGGSYNKLFAFTQVFPPVGAICLPDLTTLDLDALSFSYRELVGLLFLSLPKLAKIDLKNIRLY
ncbi:MAG: hypothetical protein Q9180_007603 [Flavoplaca navasiana]